jgi:hypothetical protein
MVDTSGITKVIASWFGGSVFWVGLGIVVLIIVGLFYAFMNRRSKLKYTCLEVLRFGNGKIGVNYHQAGMFHTHTYARGLIDYGNEIVYKLLDGRIIQGAKISQLHDLQGKKGWIVIRKVDDPKILVPIDKVRIKNYELLACIAPADYRDASIKIIESAIKETQSWADKYLPYLLIGALIIGIIISQVISMQMINNAQNKALEIQQASCGNNANVKPSTTAP